MGPDRPHSVSALLRERLKINPSIAAERVATPSAKTSPRSSLAPIDSPDGSIGEGDVETAENPDRSTDDAGEGLYDCLKCAVDVVQQASGVSPRIEEERNEKEIEEEEERDEDQEENVPDAWDVASQNTFSSRPMRYEQCYTFVSICCWLTLVINECDFPISQRYLWQNQYLF